MGGGGGLGQFVVSLAGPGNITQRSPVSAQGPTPKYHVAFMPMRLHGPLRTWGWESFSSLFWLLWEPVVFQRSLTSPL